MIIHYLWRSLWERIKEQNRTDLKILFLSLIAALLFTIAFQWHVLTLKHEGVRLKNNCNSLE